MLETVDLNAQISKEEYRKTLDTIDLELGQLQRDLRAAGLPVLVVFEGWDAAGKGVVMSRLLQALDPRGFKVHNTRPPTEEEQMRPPMRRFWLTLPPNGGISIYNRSWYYQVLEERVEGNLSVKSRAAAYERIRVFERQLADTGTVIVKFFLHISKKEQAKRFKKLSKDPAFAWKVGKGERRRHKRYTDYYQAVEDMLQETSTAYAPWTVVPATDERFANVKVAEVLAAAFHNALAQGSVKAAPIPKHTPHRTSPLDQVDMSLTLSLKEYNKRLPQLQAELRRLQHLCYVQRVPVVIIYEGWDAAGKGGNIRRLTRDLDPRGFEVIPVGPPEGEARNHHYLWRFWRALPKAGHIAVFDRSWYGRVMVERVEGFAKPQEWTRAYREINEFEAEIVDYGAVMVKFWLHISKDEQLKRFKARQKTPHKKWKITDEDWRNREKWDAYWLAVSDMIERTSTVQAPWTIVEADDKYYARVKALQVVADRIAAAVNRKQ